MSGSVRPFVGSTPMLTPMLIIACSAEPQPEARGQIGLEPQAGARGELRDPEAAPDQRDEQRQRDRHPHQAELLGQHGEQEVGVRLG